MEVPDTEPALPSMQEVAEKTRFMWLESVIVALQHKDRHVDDPTFLPVAYRIIIECLAKYLNGDWCPDYNTPVNKGEIGQQKWHWWWSKEDNDFELGWMDGSTFGQVVFKSEEIALKAREILNHWEPNDAFLKRSLGIIK